MYTSDPRALMTKAIELAVENVRSNRGGPFGAVIVQDGEIIAEGTNQVTTTNDPTAHAEVMAIRAACKHVKSFELKGCEIYTSCEPCPMCMAAIYWARLDRVYYAGTAADAAHVGFDDRFLYEQLARPHHERLIPMVSLMREQGLQPFQAWEKKTDKVPY